MALWFAGFFLGATVNAYDVSNKDYAGDPPPASHGYGAASLSDLHAPISAHRGGQATAPREHGVGTLAPHLIAASLDALLHEEDALRGGRARRERRRPQEHGRDRRQRQGPA